MYKMLDTSGKYFRELENDVPSSLREEILAENMQFEEAKQGYQLRKQTIELEVFADKPLLEQVQSHSFLLHNSTTFSDATVETLRWRSNFFRNSRQNIFSPTLIIVQD
jgi:hypothetical protein